jgi:hypothetical protein
MFLYKDIKQTIEGTYPDGIGFSDETIDLLSNIKGKAQLTVTTHISFYKNLIRQLKDKKKFSNLKEIDEICKSIASIYKEVMKKDLNTFSYEDFENMIYYLFFYKYY